MYIKCQKIIFHTSQSSSDIDKRWLRIETDLFKVYTVETSFSLQDIWQLTNISTVCKHMILVNVKRKSILLFTNFIYSKLIKRNNRINLEFNILNENCVILQILLRHFIIEM